MVSNDKNEGVVKRHSSFAVFLAPLGCQRVEDEDLWKSDGESSLGETNRSTNHRYGLTFGHDSSIRIPARAGTRAPNQSFGLARADQGHPRAALDTNNLRIPLLRAQHPIEPNRQLSCRRHFRHSLRLAVAAMQILGTKLQIATHHYLALLPPTARSNLRRRH
jgi:hypothetical protein